MNVLPPCWSTSGPSFPVPPTVSQPYVALGRVLLPAVRPGLITVGLFAFLAAWNDFIAPLILISDSEKAPLPLAVANLPQLICPPHRLTRATPPGRTNRSTEPRLPPSKARGSP
ncbi:hypothetical protein [Streptomyces sp. NPDC047043]|uniref:hypothetical protein n=1 Tax=Streptomyces sp. NPDC047043 TaxID=3154497 RepID=UPI0033D03968